MHTLTRTRLPLQCIAVFILLLFSSVARADATQPQGGQQLSFGEVGLTLGTPSGLNLNLGYWSDSSFPWVLRASGAYLGVVGGIQTDLGYAFDREGTFKQYLSLSFAYGRIESPALLATQETSTFVGAGPMYGFNLGGFALQVGAVYGSYKQVTRSLLTSATATTYGSPLQVMLQLGYTYLWE